ncbi:hypothetical protein QQS21_000641 [Conoideocrella luteorostrata]|uniref:Aflatoxin regulatory protein domain-containing protein n=1 Tax=Conoideocrella luteorostrata TaxID=1105319 RepID=A0AAJ0FZ13_9HYPO|nr:hypothetical protein QQS21_000641 [Conoideocrella luteorostrata]
MTCPLPFLSIASDDTIIGLESSVAFRGELLDFTNFASFPYDSQDMSPGWSDSIITDKDGFPADFVSGLAWDTIDPSQSRSGPSASLSQLQGSGCRSPQGPCIGQAAGLLRSIHISSPSCLLDVGRQRRDPQMSRAVDAVLSTNQGAMRAMRGFLNCPCHAKPQLQILTNVICAEIIAWYGRVVDAYSRHRHSANVDASGILPTHRVDVLRRTFSIGQHSVGGHLETTLICQVLSSRLQELEDLIGDITWSTGQPASSNSESSRGSPMLGEGDIRMNSLLHTQLTAVRRELFSLQQDTTAGALT